MAQEQAQQDMTGMYISDINVKLRDMEEKQNLIKDRILLIGENLIEEKQEQAKEILELKKQTKSLEQEINKLKLTMQRLIESQDNLAKKSQVDILERQFQMFSPLEFARIKDVEQMIQKALKEK